ncbi:hypothetical protein [Niveispirillum fermenti]|uniref:hypothetical protein n=1 Tax=Niveispirillum fermenti TaxID=1233113 RepID=UPI003A84BBA0
MQDRLNRPHAGKSPGSPARLREPKGSGGFDGLPAGLRILDDASNDVGLSEILAALAAEPAGPDMRLREVEDSIRRHWAVLRNLVREHAELSRQAREQVGAVEGETGVEALQAARPLPKVAIFTPPMRRAVAAE